jgi:hypothetical protein
MEKRQTLGNQLSKLLSSLERNGVLSDGSRVRTILCGWCRLIWHHLPPEAHSGVEIAEGYNRGSEARDRLINQRVRLWELWKETPDHYNSPTKEAKALRAAISCLYEDYEDPYLSLDFAMDVCNSLEQHEQEQLQILHSIF